jgi:hypothetical protein
MKATLLCLLPAFMLISCFGYSSTLMMEVTSSSETSVVFQQTTWHYIPEDRTFYNRQCANLKSYNKNYTFVNACVHKLHVTGTAVDEYVKNLSHHV